MGYWIIVGLIVCSFGMIIVALSVDLESTPDRPKTGEQTGSSGSHFPDGDGGRTLETAINWTAFVAAGMTRPWPDRSAALTTGGTPTVVPLSDSSVEGLRIAIADHVEACSPQIVSFQIGLDDILSGVELQTFSNGLVEILDDLEDRTIIAVVGTIPDLSALSIPALATVDPAGLQGLTRRWNAEIIRLLDRVDATIVDLFDVRLSSPSPPDGDISRISIATMLDQDAIAARFTPALIAAMRDVRELAQPKP